ncbi:MAG: hypothetical protein JNK82_29750 [Myxococcaceae bacterium]|nr:hypothetical protein [Myxococcaceae bacterium]
MPLTNVTLSQATAELRQRSPGARHASTAPTAGANSRRLTNVATPSDPAYDTVGSGNSYIVP